MIKISNDEQISEYVNKIRKRGVNTLKVFENSIDFMTAIRTPIGQQLLKDIIHIHNEYFERMIAEDTKEWEKGVYRELTRIIGTWSERVAVYAKGVEQYENETK
jgi:hypothetical protein